MDTNALTSLPFMKMHGLGNDFVVVDTRGTCLTLPQELIVALADRHRGVGFDQLAVLSGGDDLTVTFYNADGSPSAACGNATRCIAAHEMAKRQRDQLVVHVSGRGDLHTVQKQDGLVAVNMGHPVLEWQDIPLARDVDTLHLPIDGDPVATGMGNPHCSFFVEDAEKIDLVSMGPRLEHHALFPERTNVQFAHVVGPDHLRMRVWERGTGVTLASGSSSCAVAVAAHRRGLVGRRVKIDLDGGQIIIDWQDDGVWMTGPTAHVFDGVLTQSFLEAL